MADSVVSPLNYSPWASGNYNGIPLFSGYQGTSNQQTTQGSGGGLGNLSSVGNMFGGNNGIFGQASGMVNQLGTHLGFDAGSTLYSAAGQLPWQTAGGVANPALAGSAGTQMGATLSGVGAAAGLGSLAGGFLGGIGGNKANGSIGGGLGAGIGMAVGGPIGGVIGGAIGGIAGGFFGSGKPKARVSIMATGLNSDGSFFSQDQSHFGNKTLDKSGAQTQYSKLGPQFQMFQEALGAPLNFTGNIVAGYHSKWGGDFVAAVPKEFANQENVPEQFRFNYDPNDRQSYENAVSQAMGVVGKTSGFTAAQIANAQATVKNRMLLGGQQKAPEIADRNPTTGRTFDDVLKEYHVQQSRTAAPANTTPEPTV